MDVYVMDGIECFSNQGSLRGLRSVGSEDTRGQVTFVFLRSHFRLGVQSSDLPEARPDSARKVAEQWSPRELERNVCQVEPLDA